MLHVSETVLTIIHSIFPPYPVLLFTTVRIWLTAGQEPRRTDSNATLIDEPMDERRAEPQPTRKHMFSRRAGISLLSVDGELVGSLHPDNFSDLSCKPGEKVECLLLSGCVEPTFGSALTLEELKVHSGKKSDLFWVLQVVWVDGIAYRRGVGQIAAEAFRSAGAGPEVKTVMLG